MSTQVKWRRGTTEESDAFTGALAEITVDTDEKTLRVHDNVTPGGSPLANKKYVTGAQEELLPPGSQIYPDDGSVLANGMNVTAGTTHLRVLVDGESTIVAMSPVASGVVSGLTENGATIGVTSVEFQSLNNLAPLKRITDRTILANTVIEGQRIEWLGYHEPSDGGSNWGIIKKGAHTEDGGSIFSIDANTYIEANLKGKAVNIRKFGAKGVNDEINTDTQAITNARVFSKNLRIPEGVFTFSGDAILYDSLNDISVSGYGDGCVLKRVDAGSVINFNNCNKIQVYRLQVVGKFEFLASAGSVNMTGCSNFDISHIYSSSSSRQGINIEGGTHGVIGSCRVTGSYQDGIMVRSDSRRVIVKSCVCWNNGDKTFGTPIGEGIHFFDVQDCHVIASVCYDNGDHGLTFEGADYCSATDVISESNVESGCSVANTPTRSGVGSEITGLKAKNNGANGLIVSGVSDLNVIGGFAIANSGYGALIGVDSGKTQNRIAISSGFKISGNSLGGVVFDWNSVDCSLSNLELNGTTGRGILINRPECLRTRVKNCSIKNFATANVTDNGTDSIIKENEGYKTEGSGVAIFSDVSTAEFVNHGLDYTPEVSDISAFVSSPSTTNPIGNIRIYNPNTTQFTIGFDNAAGAGGVDIAWSVRRV